MPYSENRILALSLGTRECGLAVFAEGDLLYYATKELARRTKRTAEGGALHMAKEAIHKYRIGSVIVGELKSSQLHSFQLTETAARVLRALRQMPVRVCVCGRTRARSFLCPEGQATKRRAALRLAQIYPELARYVNLQSPWQRQYYDPMFDAIALGHFDNHEISDHAPAKSGATQFRLSGSAANNYSRI
jgi:hypothetical protein